MFVGIDSGGERQVSWRVAPDAIFRALREVRLSGMKLADMDVVGPRPLSAGLGCHRGLWTPAYVTSAQRISGVPLLSA